MEKLTTKIFIGLILGLIVGTLLYYQQASVWRDQYLLVSLNFLGQLFLKCIKVLVVPIVFFSLVTGACNIGLGARLGAMALKTIILYLVTTAFAIILALFVAWLFGVGIHHTPLTSHETLSTVPLSLSDSLSRLFLGNPIRAFMGENMIQLIIIAIFIGVLLRAFSNKLKKFIAIVVRINDLLMMLVFWFFQTAPYGVFCLVSVVFAKSGFGLIGQLLGFFFTVLFVSGLQWAGIYPMLLKLFTPRKVIDFYRNMRAAMLFAFSVSSSNASIPIVLETCEQKLGIRNATAAFVIPLGATINMDGTAIMQGVATVFVANLYGIHLLFSSYVMVIVTATLASIGAAGVPSMGLVTLTMVFQQVGLPVEGIALLLGVDRLLDMTRTAVNITGDCVVASIVDT